ncbi:DUF1998 domain-containing protein [Flexibacterium corallicola]|uniref:DUF1998 domain-containing protein n=1 Tax=Flexibacterium corallicola TaxID=3037259 RepID=UPI00286EF7DC|nr:DUF1998 domain-containing protein [Pseudovibrio sp. M1P-2-3]
MTEIGKIRKSQVLSTNGPGAIIDFRGNYGEPISVVAKGLEGWEKLGPSSTAKREKPTIHHARLEEQLKVRSFREPPVGEEQTWEGKRILGVPAVRFPNWHVCPKCNLLRKSHEWGEEDGQPGLYCRDCSGQTKRHGTRMFVVPVRFVVTCPSGHLSDFPWQSWATHSPSCERKHPLKLVGEGAGLRGLKIQCTHCRHEKSLDRAFDATALRKIMPSCYGDRPWLDVAPEPCNHAPVVLQRGASNVYFPEIASALDVPPWGDSFEESLGDAWDWARNIKDLDKVDVFVREYVVPGTGTDPATAAEISRKLRARLTMLCDNTIDIRTEEFLRFTERSDVADSRDEHRHFAIRPQEIPSGFRNLISHLVSVERLREVRVLTGFSRLEPLESPEAEERKAKLSAETKTWLPGIRVHGEGIFLSLEETALKEWETKEVVVERIARASEVMQKKREADGLGDRPKSSEVTPRFLLIHTLAHALAMRLSLDCGYSTASIRERLYISTETQDMCGLLLYTAAPDADGTLGGLSREGRTERFAHTLMNSIAEMEWCSSDPLCGQGMLSLSEGSGLAACHSCTFTPETTCEHFNRHLDRALLVGSPEVPEIGFFRSVLT